jgi:hypothetical protein
MASAIHSTWVSMVGGRLVKGPLGPRIMNMLGNPQTKGPRYVSGPAIQCSASVPANQIRGDAVVALGNRFHFVRHRSLLSVRTRNLHPHGRLVPKTKKWRPPGNGPGGRERVRESSWCPSGLTPGQPGPDHAARTG